MKSIKLWEPWYFENSKLPVLLSKIYRMEVAAFSAAFWVFARGEMSDKTRRTRSCTLSATIRNVVCFSMDLLWDVLVNWIHKVQRF